MTSQELEVIHRQAGNVGLPFAFTFVLVTKTLHRTSLNCLQKYIYIYIYIYLKLWQRINAVKFSRANSFII